MYLWYPAWGILSLGSVIAMIGVSINQIYGLRNHKLPPFSTALGTPILVFLAFSHLLRTSIWDKYELGSKLRKKFGLAKAER